MNKLFICIIAFLIASSTFAQDNLKKITLDDLWKNYKFYPQSVDGLRSMNDGEFYTVLENNTIIKNSYKTGLEVEKILNATELKAGRVFEYEFSSDESKILLETEKQPIYRRSFKAAYHVYDIKTKTLTPVSTNGKQQLATFSPDGKKVAFVRENNLFVKDLISLQEVQITTDGKYNEIINGAPDWVYEEEFEFNKAFEWSVDGKYLAFIRFDESKVKMFGMTLFAGMAPKIIANENYPDNKTFKYPKAGEANSEVSVWVFNTISKDLKKMDIGAEKDIYIPRIRWTQDPNILCIFRMNRLQNKLELLFSNPNDGSNKVFLTEENKYFIDETGFDQYVFLEDKLHFIMPSERDGYNHLYLYKLDGTLVRQLTKGNWDISGYLGYDSKKKVFYYESYEQSSIRKDVYSVDFDAKKKTRITTSNGVNSIEFSKGYKYYILSLTNSTTPTYITLHDAAGKVIRVLEDNAALKKTIAEYSSVTKEFFTIKTSENVELNASILKPSNFDPNKKYPVLINQYSGPNSQQVRDAFEFGWEEMLAQNGVLVVTIDPRGTAGKGEAFRKVTYLNLGKYETLDMIESAKYLGKLPYIDPARIGIWGWSFGGYMVCSALTVGAEYFKLGVAVAPVTNWRFYDNIYTERFMRTPQTNAKGYDDNSPINQVSKLKGKLLIIHGSADDNVHVQNTMEFVEALVQANKQFDMMIYTNRNHGIYGGNTRIHLYTKMTDYILNNL